jgi:thioesterase domain-containing protein
MAGVVAAARLQRIPVGVVVQDPRRSGPLSWLPPGHEVPMHLFVSEASAADAEADLLGWDEFHKGTLTVDRLAGDHVTLLELPEVEQPARMMLESLRKARASTRLAAEEIGFHVWR